MNNNQRGLALVQVLFILGAVVSLSYTTIQNAHERSRIYDKFVFNQEIKTLERKLEVQLADSRICTESLKGRGVGDQIDKLKSPDGDILEIKKTFGTGKVEVQSMELVEINKHVVLKLDLIKGRQEGMLPSILGGGSISTYFPLSGALDDAGDILECFSDIEGVYAKAQLKLPKCFIFTDEKCGGYYSEEVKPYEIDVQATEDGTNELNVRSFRKCCMKEDPI